MSDQTDIVNKGDRNKIYFLVIVIAALLGTNAYLFFRDKQQNDRYVTISTEKDRLKLEVEKIEVELDKVNALNVTLSDKLIREQDMARQKIAELKLALQHGQLTQEDLAKAQEEVKELREFVKTHNETIIKLEKENSALKDRMDSLRKSASSAARLARELEQQNSELSAKVKTSAALKATNLGVVAYRVKSSGKSIGVNKAGSAKKLSVSFDIVPNALAEKNYHKVYLRVFDPAGNLIANENNMFEADGQEMQYSSATSISFNDDNTSYIMDWINPNPFMKGIYSIILYVDGYTMGRAEIELR
jgi:thiamine kinase-like enzyme